MSQENPILEPTNSDSQALPAAGETFSDPETIAESKRSISKNPSVSEDVWELVDTEGDNQPVAGAKVSAEKTELAAESSSSLKRSSRVTLRTSTAAKQTTRWQRFQKYWQTEIQPALKEQTIKTLKATIRSLEFLVSRLEAKPSPSSGLPQSGAPRRHRGVWGSVLDLTRSLLPRSLRRLSDLMLSGAISGVLLLTLWTTSSLIFSQSPTQVATAPPASAPVKPTDGKDKLVLTDQPVVKPPPDAIATEPRPKQTLLAPTEKTPDAIINPAKPAPSPTNTPVPKPTPPPLKLTPEQTLIARIQDQVADVSNHYVSGLIQSVQANFRSSLLTVKVGDDWYTLAQAQQNKLANEMLNRAQQLSFVKLELTDPEGNLLARSPVVGSEMVILQRTTSQKTV